MLTRRTLLASASLALAAPYLGSPAAADTPKNIVVLAKWIDDVVGGFDPAEAYEGTNIELCNGNLYRTLVSFATDGSGELGGDLAESWEVAEDGGTITFRLRDSVTFEGGATLSAEDAAFSLQRVLKLGKSPSADLAQFGWTAENAEEVIRVGDAHTLVLALKEKRAPGTLLACLATSYGGVVEKAVVLAQEIDGDIGNAWLRTHSAGTGPYKLLDWKASDRIVLGANAAAVTQPKVQRLVMRHIPDPATQLLLLGKGDVDMGLSLSSDQIKSVEANGELSVVATDSLTSMYMAMNMSLPQFQKPQVLQAIKWAIDYDAIAKNITPNTWNVWQSFEPKGVKGALDHPLFKKDVAKAKALLAEAGYAEGFSVTLDHYATSPFSDIAQALQADLAEIGIDLQLRAGEVSQVTTKFRARQHDMVLGMWGPNYVEPGVNAQAFCFNPDDSDGAKQKLPAWRTHFADTDLTAAVLAAASELDENRRTDMYKKMQIDFAERAPFVFLLQQAYVAVQRKGVSGIAFDPLANARYAGVEKA